MWSISSRGAAVVVDKRGSITTRRALAASAFAVLEHLLPQSRCDQMCISYTLLPSAFHYAARPRLPCKSLPRYPPSVPTTICTSPASATCRKRMLLRRRHTHRTFGLHLSTPLSQTDRIRRLTRACERGPSDLGKAWHRGGRAAARATRLHSMLNVLCSFFTAFLLSSVQQESEQHRLAFTRSRRSA